MKTWGLSQTLSSFLINYLSISTFSSGIDFDEVLEEMKTRFAPHKRSYSFCHYQIIDNQVIFGSIVLTLNSTTILSKGIQTVLRRICGFRSIHGWVPQVFVIKDIGSRLGVRLQFRRLASEWQKDRTSPSGDLMVWFHWFQRHCDTDLWVDRVFPSDAGLDTRVVWFNLKTNDLLPTKGRISLDILSVMGKQSIKLEEKKDVLFWRGRDSNEFRLKLVRLSKNNSDLINASLTNFFFFRDQMEDLGPKSPYISFFDFFQYKYQINIDGTVAAYRLPYLLAGNSLVLKQDSKYYEFFYNLLKPDVHYIKVDKELNQLMEILNSLRENDSKLKEIIKNSNQLVLENLLPEHVFCYHFNLFQKYSKLLRKGVQLRPEMTKVFADDQNQCNCRQNNEIRDEL